jgi:hypothetical protein
MMRAGQVWVEMPPDHRLGYDSFCVQCCFRVRRVVIAEWPGYARVGTRRKDDELVTWLGEGRTVRKAVNDALRRVGGAL